MSRSNYSHEKQYKRIYTRATLMYSFLELNLSFHGLSYSRAEKKILDSVLILLIEKDDGEKSLRAQVHIIIPFRVRSTLDLSSQIPFFRPYSNEFSYQIFFLPCLNIYEEKRSFALMVSTLTNTFLMIEMGLLHILST